MSETKQATATAEAEYAGWQTRPAAPLLSIPSAAERGEIQPVSGVAYLGLKRLFRFRSGTFDLSAALEVEREHGHLFLFVPVFIGAGAALWYALPATPALHAILLTLLGLSWPAWFLRDRPGVMPLMLAAAALLPLGMVLAAFETWRTATIVLDSPVTTRIEGRVLSREADDDGRIRYVIAVRSTDDPKLRRPPERVRLLARSEHMPIPIGGTIAGRARLGPPSGPALSGLNDFGFDAYMAGIGAYGFFYGGPERLADPPDAGTLRSAVERQIALWRSNLTEHIRGRIGGDAGAIAAALVTAEQRAISEETVEALRQAGLAHVLAISGLNMVLAAGTFLVGARMALASIHGLAERYPIKKIAAAGALIMVTAYILVSGGAISAVRSWIMISIMLMSLFFDRAAISLRNVALSAIVILAITPSAITGPGFQMSYAATLGLVAGYAAWRERPNRRVPGNTALDRFGGPVLRFFGGLLLSSLIGGLATLIYSVGHFHRIPAYGLVGNLVAMPVISLVVMPMGLIGVMLMPFGLDAIPFAIMGRGIDWMIALAGWVAGWGGEIVTGRIPMPAFLLIGLGGGLLCILRTRLRLIGAAMTGIGLILTAMPDRRLPAELLISEDGRLVAFVAEKVARTNRARPPDFIYAQWRRALRLEDHTGPAFVAGENTSRKEANAVSKRRQKETPNTSVKDDKADLIEANVARRLMNEAFASGSGLAQFQCRRKAWCTASSPSGWKVITLEKPAYLGPACDSADIVVVPYAIRTTACRSGAMLVTSRTLRRTGALEIRPLDASQSADTQRYNIEQAIGSLQRPWSRHRLYDWRSGRFEGENHPPGVNGSVE